MSTPTTLFDARESSFGVERCNVRAIRSTGLGAGQAGSSRRRLHDLKTVADLYAVDIVDTSHRVRNGNLPWEAGIASVELARGRIGKAWAAYVAIFMEEIGAASAQMLASASEPLAGWRC